MWIERALLPERRITDADLPCRAVPGPTGRVYLEPPGLRADETPDDDY